MIKLTIIFLDRHLRVVSSTVMTGKPGEPVPGVLTYEYSGYGDLVPSRFPEHDATFTRWLEGKPDRTDTASTGEVGKEDTSTTEELFKGDTAHAKEPMTKGDVILLVILLVITVCVFVGVFLYFRHTTNQPTEYARLLRHTATSIHK